MGGFSSKDNRRQVKGGIYVDIPKTAYISNEVVSGMLHINLLEPFQGHVLVVSLEGVEETCFTYETGTGDDKRSDTARGNRRFLNFSQPIFDFANNDGSFNYTMQPGQWSIPFCLQIGDKLPSSINYFISQLHCCSIKYNICAYIVASDANVKPVQGNQTIFIGQQIEKGIQPIFKQVQTAPAICCCFSTGRIELKCTLNQPSFSPCEVMRLKIEGDFTNNSKQIKNLKVELKGILEMKADNTISTQLDALPIASVLVPVNGTSFHQEVQINIPEKLNLSAKGELLKLEYFAYITPELNASCVSRNTPLTIQVQLNPTPSSFQYLQLPQIQHMQPPQYWNPQVLQQRQYSDEEQLRIQQVHLNFQQSQQEYKYYLNPDNNMVKQQAK